ncbi:hypothetical protein AMK59_5298 [Oryctes borbonicus]|uniref:tRNA uridine 5-carboxymethylaminomethyl modification enzyme C-terminal subdomain domain-containing protein n=1 Tax=Oryctes borbonicus TaxID=1629725 RepID=A0A0T6B195_9SCAR|nr:hypothetical protein AMK59_5298 [Oryctes borbonicus]
MYTCRAEFRLMLRPDNADLRLTEKGYITGCVSKERYNRTKEIESKIQDGVARLKSISKAASYWKDVLKLPPTRNNMQKTAFEVLQYGNHGVTISDIAKVIPELKALTEDKNLERRLQIEALYENAVQSQAHEVAEMKRDEAYVIPKDIDYNSDLLNLSFEEREKLMSVQPQTIAAASRIPGVTPSAVFNLLRFAKCRENAVNI